MLRLSLLFKSFIFSSFHCRIQKHEKINKARRRNYTFLRFHFTFVFAMESRSRLLAEKICWEDEKANEGVEIKKEKELKECSARRSKSRRERNPGNHQLQNTNNRAESSSWECCDGWEIEDRESTWFNAFLVFGETLIAVVSSDIIAHALQRTRKTFTTDKWRNWFLLITPEVAESPSKC